MAPRIRISEELYKHLKLLGSGTLSKRLDKIVLGKETKPIERKKKRKFPESAVLYPAILGAFKDTNEPKTRKEILEHVDKTLRSTDEVNKYPKWFDNNMSWRSAFSITMDNRIMNLVRSNTLRREDGKIYQNR